MSLIKQIKFLEQCENNIDKLNFYLDMTDGSISCEPCLILKCYYNWSLKKIYNLDMREVNLVEYFTKTIEKLDYKVINNMVYEDFRDLIIAYYSLGEIYFQKNNIQLSKDYFTKVIEIMEEFLKDGNRFQTEEIQCKSGVVFFELLMWARKNLGDMVEAEEALPLYESIIGEAEILYVQKNYSIYRVSKELNLGDKANEAARCIIKLMPSYKGINVDSVEFLTSIKEYSNAIDIATGQYLKNDSPHWINAINIVCNEAELLDIECVNKVIKFSDLLMEDLKMAEWGILIFSLYKGVRDSEAQLIEVLEYLKQCFSKVNYKYNDFINCPDAVCVLNEIYEDIRLGKYTHEFLRKYEFDFAFDLMNVAVQNENYERGLETSTKLSSVIEIFNTNKDVCSYINNLEDVCKGKVEKENYNLSEYPWAYLHNNLKYICTNYGIEPKITQNDITRNNSKHIFVGINAIQNKSIEDILSSIIGKNIFKKDKDLIFVCKEELALNEDIKKNYDFDVIVNNDIFKDSTRCIVTYDKSTYASITDRNIIVLDGHKELRDIDITYIKHILEVSSNTEILLLVNRMDKNYKEETVNYNKFLIVNLLAYEKEMLIVDLKDFSESRLLLETIMGEDSEKIIPLKFENFKTDVNNELEAISEDIKLTNGVYKERRNILKECIEEYSNIEDEIKSNCEEFISKIDNDIEFLGKYAEDKISVIIPDIIEKNLYAIDDLEDVSTIKEKADKIFSEAIINWCNKSIYDLMLEQFEVYITKYSKLYGYHEDTLEKINDNRNGVISAYSDFRAKVKIIEIKPSEELIKEFLVLHDDFLNTINYEVTVVPNVKFLNTVTDGIKVMFMKSEEKAESMRIKIKNQVIENKNNIAAVLSGNIIENLKGLSEKLQQEIKEIFEGTMKEITIDKSVVNEAIKVMESEHEEFSKKQEETEILMKFINIEVLKYSKQVNSNMVYSDNKCYKLIED